MGLIESTVPGASTKIADPCTRCGIEEGVWSVAWPDLPANELYLLCARCLWRKFHELPKGPVRKALLRRVFARRLISGKSP